MFNFLIQHRQFYKLKTIYVLSKDKVLFSLDIHYQNGENILKLEDIVKLDEELEKDRESKLFYEIYQIEDEIVKTLKYKLGKSVIRNEDISQFLENHQAESSQNILLQLPSIHLFVSPQF